ncbi:CLUMA_CG014642, isoform A [Clunio marinus]|uniref:CLUMA_CG014642, isoform A n=1 Tax=Clunio marinus TaxID=568069 RepID=A0A1J1IMU9_9DIPT|nr:CLUMA_CG014642, isoform A [Clunio marinus]
MKCVDERRVEEWSQSTHCNLLHIINNDKEKADFLRHFGKLFTKLIARKRENFLKANSKVLCVKV